jgi:hypothetical protein
MTPREQIRGRLLAAVSTVPAGVENDKEIGRLIFEAFLMAAIIARCDASHGCRCEMIDEEVDDLEKNLLKLSGIEQANGS